MGTVEEKRVLRLLLALPLLPPGKITQQFQSIHSQSHALLFSLGSYMEKQWITSTVFPPECWSVFGQTIRTNNSTEGWHSRFKSLINQKRSISLYQLIDFCHKEADYIDLTCSLVRQEKTTQLHRGTAAETNRSLLALWELYNNHDISAKRLLIDGANIMMKSGVVDLDKRMASE